MCLFLIANETVPARVGSSAGRVVQGLCGTLPILASILLAGCGSSTTPSGDRPGSGGRAPSITANPNPVAAGGKFGKTTITWDTGNGSVGEVYVSVNGAAEKRFAGNRAKGSLEAPWIGKGEHVFRLYEGKEHKIVLASVTVTRSRK
jgi:hypothetical protein